MQGHPRQVHPATIESGFAMIMLVRFTTIALAMAAIIIVLMLAFFVVPRMLPADGARETLGSPAHSTGVLRL